MPYLSPNGRVMRQIGILFLLFIAGYAQSQNVGIGVSVPLDKLHVDSNIRIGVGAWSSPINNRFLKIGDGNFVTIGEVGLDDRMEFSAREFLFKNSGAYGLGNGKVGINISSSPTAFLEVNGNVKITDGTQAEGKVLTSAADGTASWQYTPHANTAFQVKLSTANQTIVDATDAVVLFDNLEIDDAFSFNTSNGTYLSPSAGVYHFDVKIEWALAVSAQALLTVYIDVNGTAREKMKETFVLPAGTNSKTMSFGTNLKLNAADVVKVYVRQDSGDTQEIVIQNSSFSGHKLY